MTSSIAVCVLPGDGIGPEVTECAMRVIDALPDPPRVSWSVRPAGYECWNCTGRALPDETLEDARAADAVLVGAFDAARIPPTGDNPIRGIRRGLGIEASLRPAVGVTPQGTLDIVIVREVTEGLYSGLEHMIGSDTAVALRVVTRAASLAVARAAFELAEARPSRHVTVVHKISALGLSDGLFLECAREVARRHPTVELAPRAVDACAMELITAPGEFDVILTTNAFGDILADLAAALTGGIGLAASSCVGSRWAYFEPVHGTAPRKAGRGIANPIATIRAAALMLGHLGFDAQHRRVEAAVAKVLSSGPRTVDRGGAASSAEVTNAVIAALRP